MLLLGSNHPTRSLLLLTPARCPQITRNGAWWRYIEHVKGEYDFTNIDKWASNIKSATGSACATGENPMQMTFVLNGGNHLYGGEDYTSPTTPEQVEGYTNFVVAVLKNYKGQGIIWELYNEPDLSVRKMTVEQYSKLVISVGQAVRGTPEIANELLMGPSTSTVDCDYMTQFKNLGALQYVDAVSVHAYVTGAPEQNRWQFAKIRNIIGSGKALVSGEWGWSTCTNGAGGQPAECVGGTKPDILSFADQAMYVARQWLVNALERIPLSIYYEYMNDDTDTFQCESNWGLVQSNGQAKPSYHAAVAVQKFVGRRPFLSQLPTHGNKIMEYVLAFGAAGSGYAAPAGSRSADLWATQAPCVPTFPALTTTHSEADRSPLIEAR
jgi:hypothetical protein